MLVYQHKEQRVLTATPEAVFDLLGDPAQHPRLAGSGEVKTVRLRDDQPTGVGSSFEADEEIRVARKMQRFTAVSTVVEYDPARVISWISVAPSAPSRSRVQWWYDLECVEAGTRVTERVEVDLGLGALSFVVRLPYRAMRGSAIRTGMTKTLENLERLTAVTAG
jgi:uncharacterized protein YndB with AHSA1/START domain